MMRRHARQIIGDAANGLAEEVTYRFKAGGEDRVFNAIVRRTDLQPSTPQSPQVTKRRARIEIPRHPTLGVETIAKGDSVVVSMRIGDEAQECRITGIIGQDDAQFVVEVEA